MAGILPFGAVFIELFFILTALWENQFYYLFGFLFLVFCILVISCSQISIVMVYFQLCGEVSNKQLFSIVFIAYILMLFYSLLGLPMVVEKLYCQWRISYICPSLLNFLFYDKIRNNRTNSNTFIFWLHCINGINVLVINRYNRFLCCLCIYS